jgi:DNA-binding transcriptional LysR family regulator
MAINKNLKNVDLNLLVIFEAIFATGNISRSADRLGMSQPAVSHSLARLRELFDDQLFVRTPRGVEPTSKSRELINPVREALGLIGRQLGQGVDIDLANYKRMFRIVVVDPLEPILMPSVVRTITNEAPGISIECAQFGAKIEDEIRGGTIDLACVPHPFDTTDLVIKPIVGADMVVVSRRNHPGVTKPLDLDTFHRLPHIGLRRDLRPLTGVDKTLAANTLPRRVVYMAAKVWSIPAIVERTDLIGMLPRPFVKQLLGKFDLDVHEVPVAIPEQHIYMVWHVNNEHDPGHIWLRQTMMQAMKAVRAAAEASDGARAKAV